VIGLFVYAVVVARFKSFSGWAGVLALALIVIPVVIRTTENMLRLVPQPARGGLRAGRAQVEGDPHDHAARRAAA
jgi:ABC-type phosphate transport system permease subunit